MKTFKDNAGRTWQIAMNVTVAKRVRSMLGVDLLALGGEADKPEDHLFTRLHSDPCFLVDVLYVVCKTEADAQGVSDEQFGEAMAGDAIDQATKALLEEIVDFSPSPRDRARARRVLDKATEMIGRAQDVLDLRTTDEALESQMADALKGLEPKPRPEPRQKALGG